MPGKFGQIQPTLFEAKDGEIVALMRSRNPRMVCRAESKDGGKTFTPAEETDLPNPSAGIDAVKTKAGDVFLIYNPTPIARTPISLARSTDDGKTWKKVADLETEPGEYSYPAMIESAAGNAGDHLHVAAYAHQARERRTRRSSGADPGRRRRLDARGRSGVWRRFSMSASRSPARTRRSASTRSSA